MAVIRREVVNGSITGLAYFTPVTAGLDAKPGLVGRMLDKKGVWMTGVDGLYPRNAAGTTYSQLARVNSDAAAATRNLVVAANIVLGSTSAQVAVTTRATVTNALNAGYSLMLNGPTGLLLGRFAEGSTTLNQLNLDTEALALSATTEYTAWIAAYSANASDDFDSVGWATTKAAWGTDLTTRLTHTNDQAVFDGDTVTWGVMCYTGHEDTKVTGIMAWEWDGTYSAIGWADSDPAGPKLKVAQIGGVGSFTYQWQRSTAANSGFANLSGATTAEHTDTTATEGTIYFYKCVITDTGNSNATATSEVLYARKLPSTINIGFVGTSWMSLDRHHLGSSVVAISTTELYTGTVPQLVGKRLAARMGRRVNVTNQGVSGSKSSQWVSGQTNMDNALVAFTAAGVTHVYVDAMDLNDSSDGVSAATYKANLQDICNTLVNEGYTVLLGYGGWYFPSNTSGRGAAGLDTHIAYMAANDQVVNNQTIFPAGRMIPKTVIDNPGLLSDLLHPGVGGAEWIADLIAGDFHQLITTGGTTGGTPIWGSFNRARAASGLIFD